MAAERADAAPEVAPGTGEPGAAPGTEEEPGDWRVAGAPGVADAAAGVAPGSSAAGSRASGEPTCSPKKRAERTKR